MDVTDIFVGLAIGVVGFFTLYLLDYLIHKYLFKEG